MSAFCQFPIHRQKNAQEIAKQIPRPLPSAFRLSLERINISSLFLLRDFPSTVFYLLSRSSILAYKGSDEEHPVLTVRV